MAGSADGLHASQCHLAAVTTPDATAVLDGDDPAAASAVDLLGSRPDAATGLARRVVHVASDGAVGATPSFRSFSPVRLREAAAGTEWTVRDVN